MSNSLDPDQAQRFVGPDLGPNCCKGYQRTTLVGKELMDYKAGIIVANISEPVDATAQTNMLSAKMSTLLITILHYCTITSKMTSQASKLQEVI